MFYRRKIILSLLQLYNNQLDKISLQKLLFLFTRQQQKPVYDFVPYRYGCYSFSLYADLNAMVGKEWLQESEKMYTYIGQTDYLTSLEKSDLVLLKEIREQYGKMNAQALMKHTYLNFPYWATHSLKAKEILSPEQLIKVQASRHQGTQTILFTIGYEGISLEEYLNRLVRNDVKVLVDVRRNPLSMKFGFSKNQLKRFCSNLGIEYVHIPEVGIQSEQRQELNNQSDYDKLFAFYRQHSLSRTGAFQDQIMNLLIQQKRIALTCFEANICQCHRKHLAEALEKRPDFLFEVKHI